MSSFGRPPAAVRNAKRLVQINMTDIRPNLRRTAQNHLRIQIRPIHVNLPAVLVNDAADFFDRFLKDTVGRGVGDHQARKVCRMLFRFRFQICDIDISLLVASDCYDLEASHHRARWIRPVRRRWNQTDPPVGLSARSMVIQDRQQPGVFTL